MSLDIGGAETHIVELSKELRRNGNEVVVVSNGGVYVSELADAGIRHYCAPMHRRNIFSMIKSYFLLRRVIQREKTGHCTRPRPHSGAHLRDAPQKHGLSFRDHGTRRV